MVKVCTVVHWVTTPCRVSPKYSVFGAREETGGSIVSFYIANYVYSMQSALQASSGPEGSRNLRFPDFVTTAQDRDKVVSLTHRPPLPLRK